MLGFLRKVQTSLCLYVDLWNKSTNEITPLIDGTIGIATVEPFSNADFFHYAVVLCYIWCLLSQNLPWQKWVNSAKIRLNQEHIPFKRFILSFLQAKRNVNTFLRVVRSIIRQYNFHSWEFVIKAQLNGSRSLRLWNLWPKLCIMPFINSSIRKFKHTVFLLLITY